MTNEQIQVVFCDADGETTKTLTFTPSHVSHVRCDESLWDRDQAIHAFRAFLETKNDDGLQALMRAFDRLDCWHEAIAQLADITPRNKVLGDGLLSFWTVYGFHIADSLKGDWTVLADSLRHHLDPYTGSEIKLYRGELASRHTSGTYGIAWTPRFKTAEMFGHRRAFGEGPGVILEITATPDMIISAPTTHSLYLNEDEYVIDPRLIREVRVISASA
jgi:hypothetical protein